VGMVSESVHLSRERSTGKETDRWKVGVK
jgi:hypothetical protein